MSASRLLVPLTLVALATAGFGWLNSVNARAMAPNWGQDLAFFTQIIHSAAHGGAWASPLLFEPQGFFAMVHTHLVLPLVVALYALLPHQSTLLYVQAFFASLALWPAFRLGEATGGRVTAWMVVVALVAFGPFQALATADFRPVALFVPGVLGVFSAARSGRSGQALGWGMVAIAGREEGVYLVMVAGGVLALCPWGADRWRVRLRRGATIWALGVAGFVAFSLIKPEMFFHFDPFRARAPLSLDAETLAARWAFGAHLARSGWIVGLLSPAGLVAALPVGWQMVHVGQDWPRLVGPSAHYSAFWLPFVVASGAAGLGRLPGRLRPLVGVLMIAGNTLAFPWAWSRVGPVALRPLCAVATPGDRVAADYDTIHCLAGRAVLWNQAQLYLPEAERPLGWRGPWPLGLDDVDLLVVPADDPLVSRAEGWRVVARAGDHVALRHP